MTIDTAISLVIIALLIPTIAYAVILNRKLTALRKSRDEFAKVIANFNDATLRAEAAIPKLKKATHEASVALKDRVEKAQALRDDLAFMIERAEEMAGKLESGVRVARSEAAFGTAVQQPSAAPPSATLAGGMRPAVAPVEPVAPARVASPLMAAKAATVGAAPFEDAAVDLRNALNAARAEARVAEGRMMGGPTPASPAAPPLRAPRKSLADELGLTEDRSEAERELLKALQSGR
jgi:prophage DNA circulation protein